MLDAQDMTEVGVDDAAVGHDEKRARAEADPLDGALHGRDDAGPKLWPGLSARRHAEHGLLLAEPPGQLFVLGHDVLEPHPFP